MVFHIMKTSIVAKSCKISSYALQFVVVTKFQATEACSSLDLTKAKHSIIILLMAENKNVSVRNNPNNFLACEEKRVNMMRKMKFAINMYTQTLNTICSQYKRISKSVLIF
jgi:hypothetical protein